MPIITMDDLTNLHREDPEFRDDPRFQALDLADVVSGTTKDLPTINEDRTGTTAQSLHRPALYTRQDVANEIWRAARAWIKGFDRTKHVNTAPLTERVRRTRDRHRAVVALVESVSPDIIDVLDHAPSAWPKCDGCQRLVSEVVRLQGADDTRATDYCHDCITGALGLFTGPVVEAPPHRG